MKSLDCTQYIWGLLIPLLLKVHESITPSWSKCAVCRRMRNHPQHRCPRGTSSTQAFFSWTGNLLHPKDCKEVTLARAQKVKLSQEGTPWTKRPLPGNPSMWVLIELQTLQRLELECLKALESFFALVPKSTWQQISDSNFLAASFLDNTSECLYGYNTYRKHAFSIWNITHCSVSCLCSMYNCYF